MNNLNKFDASHAIIVDTLIWDSLLINAAEKKYNRVLSLFTGAKTAHMWWLPFCVDVVKSRGVDLAKAMNSALAFLGQHCQRQNVKRDQISGVFKLLYSTNESSS